MKRTIGALALTGILALSGCEEKKEITYTTLQGTVFSERYMPASVGWGSVSSKYSFSIDTENERKGINVVDKILTGAFEKNIYGVPKETIDSLIEPGTRVEIKVDERESEQQSFNVFSNHITVLGE